jgi:hypothetical protein
MEQQHSDDFYSNIVSRLRARREQAIIGDDTTQGIAVNYVGCVASRRLPASNVYELESLVGETTCVIDSGSQNGFLTLTNIKALRGEPGQNIYISDCGTYERNETSDRRIASIYLDLQEERPELRNAFFSRSDIDELIDQGKLWALGTGGAGLPWQERSLLEQAVFYFEPELKRERVIVIA